MTVAGVRTTTELFLVKKKKLDRGGIFFVFATLVVARVEKTLTPDLKDTGSNPAVVSRVVLSLANPHCFGVGKVHSVNYIRSTKCSRIISYQKWL